MAQIVAVFIGLRCVYCDTFTNRIYDCSYCGAPIVIEKGIVVVGEAEVDSDMKVTKWLKN